MPLKSSNIKLRSQLLRATAVPAGTAESAY